MLTSILSTTFPKITVNGQDFEFHEEPIGGLIPSRGAPLIIDTGMPWHIEKLVTPRYRSSADDQSPLWNIAQ